MSKFVWIRPIFRKAGILIGKFIVLIAILELVVFALGKLNWVPFENWAIDQLAHAETHDQSPLLFQDKVDIPDTISYKKEKYFIFKTDIKNTMQLLASKVGIQTGVPIKKEKFQKSRWYRFKGCGLVRLGDYEKQPKRRIPSVARRGHGKDHDGRWQTDDR